MKRRAIRRRTRQRLSSPVPPAVVAAGAALVAAACGSVHTTAPAVQAIDSAVLTPGHPPLTRLLPHQWSISFDVRFGAPRAALKIGLSSSVVTIYDGGRVWHRARLTERVLTVDGRTSALSAADATAVSLRASGGTAQIRGLRIVGRS
jgi:hypothetical protein